MTTVPLPAPLPVAHDPAPMLPLAPASAGAVLTDDSLPSTIEYEEEEFLSYASWVRQEFTAKAPETCLDKSHEKFMQQQIYFDGPEWEMPAATAHHFFGIETVPAGYIAVFHSSDDTVTLEKDVGELTAAEVKANWPAVEKSVRKEVASFQTCDTFRREKKGVTSNCMSSRWLFRWKTVDGVKVVKARLTVRGFEDHEADELSTFAGTSSRWTQRLVSAMAAINRWPLMTMDVSTAFLQGLDFKQLSALTGTPERQVAFTAPKGYEWAFKELPGLADLDLGPTGTEVLRMTKCIYGLKDAPRAWRLRLHQAMTDAGASASVTDPALYLFFEDIKGKPVLCMMASCHVDDLKVCGSSKHTDQLQAYLESQFGALTIRRGVFEHCGILHEQDPASFEVFMHQRHYAARLKSIDTEAFDTENATLLAMPLSASEHSQYLSVLGGLSWMLQTRGDISIYVQALQRASKAPTKEHLWRLNRVVKWTKRKHTGLRYRHVPQPWRVQVLSDSAFRKEDSTGLAMRGALIGLMHDEGAAHHHPDGVFNVLEWYSRKQRRVTRSTFAAELQGLIDSLEIGRVIVYTISELLWARATPAQLARAGDCGELPVALEACVDAKSVFDALCASETRTPSESSLILVLLQVKEFLRHWVLRSLYWIHTQDMASDGLNKGAVSRHALLAVPMIAEWKLLHSSEKHQELRTAPPVSSAASAATFFPLPGT